MALQYVSLNRDCLRDVREHEESHQAQLRTVQRPEDCRPWLDEQLAKIKASNAQSRYPRVTSQIDMALRILSGMQTTVPPEDPETFLKKQVLLPYHDDPSRAAHPRDLVAKAHSVLAAMAHSRFDKCIWHMLARDTTAAGSHGPRMVQLALHELGNAMQHALLAANTGLFSCIAAIVCMDFMDLAAWHGIDVKRDPRFNALLCAIAEYQARTCLDELGNMLNNPQAGFGSPLCAMPTCISYSRIRTPREYPNLVRCADGCLDAIHATYCSVQCREEDAVRHMTAAKGAFKLEPPICLRSAEAARALQEVLKRL